jgi:predicted ATP-dependent endonuclease of OLD family
LPGQRIIATHSGAVAAATSPRRLRRLVRVGGDVQLHRLSDDVSDEAVLTLVRYVLWRRPDLLFARVALLVEGETEERTLTRYLSARWPGGEPEGAGVVAVSTEGVTKLHHVTAALASLAIPWVALVDGDAEGTAALRRVEAQLGRDPLAEPTVALQLPGGRDIEAHCTAEHSELIAQLIGERKMAAQRLLGNDPPDLVPDWMSRPDESLIKELDQHKGIWGIDFVRVAIEGSVAVSVFDDLINMAATRLGGDT